jgi:hypothetical protein
MTLQGQLGQSARFAQLPPVAAPSLANLLPTGNANTGLLGNAYAQVVHFSYSTYVDDIIETYRTLLTGAQPSYKLALLKRQKFTPQGRQARIANSIAALNARQPTDLTLAQWKAILEEIEDED